MGLLTWAAAYTGSGKYALAWSYVVTILITTATTTLTLSAVNVPDTCRISPVSPEQSSLILSLQSSLLSAALQGLLT